MLDAKPRRVHARYDAYFTEAQTVFETSGATGCSRETERVAGRFLFARWHSPQDCREVVPWCPNDYLGRGQHLQGDRSNDRDRDPHRNWGRRHVQHRRHH